VITAGDGSEGLNQFHIHRPDLVILDIMMPGINGWKICDLIRQYSHVPIIMVSALGREQDVIRGFNYGADDYITKPFSPNILLARAQASLRRAAQPLVTKNSVIYSDAYLTIDAGERRVFVDGSPVKLSDREFRLLILLAQNVGRVLTFEQILKKIWGWEYQNNVDYVHVYISQLRRKVEQNPKHPQYLLTEHSVGYRFEAGNA
jgi:two-component system KDP operon response regulator KdpE